MDFSIKQMIRFGWETFKTRPWFFIGATLVILLAYVVSGALSGAIDMALTGDPDKSSGVGDILGWLLGTLISMGVVAFYLQAHDNPAGATISSLWHPHPFWIYFAATLLVGLAVVVGLLLLIVPGIIFALMFMFTSFIVIDRNLGPIEAMKESKRITHGHKWQLFGLGLLLALINLGGAIAFGVGLLVTIPVTSLAFTHAYRVLGARPLPAEAAATALAA